MTGLQRVERKDPLLWPVVHIEFTVLSEDRPTLLGHVFLLCVCVFFPFFARKERKNFARILLGKFPRDSINPRGRQSSLLKPFLHICMPDLSVTGD